MTANKQDLKNIIKPLIKECVKEVILESGVLSKIITEVVTGLKGSLVVEAQATPQRTLQTEQEKPKRIKSSEELKAEQQAKSDLIREKQEKAQKMMAATGMSRMFDNIPIPSEITPELTSSAVREVIEIKPDVPLTAAEKEELFEQKKRIKEEEAREASLGAKGGMALRGIDPGDPGINIKGIMEIAGGRNAWVSRLKK